ncbi:PTS mannose/fructose/sorbose transporter subunit IIB [Oenococcus oeni]|uniref:PTS sugar transporter subunit IIB n=1 Tax=Oenococcus oeni TaxID=1247 RepID=UPI0010BADC5C|nr:PTS sugar transporter subunit IIB [Oenococcus oeni]SYW04890.1 PTS mannose/fructose/sorbose transporter subunit IIB [Oenococcus oeni]
MPVIEARVDQRLIHGIVVNQWNSKLNPKRFMVVDDLVCNQEDIKESMRLSKPVGTGMSIINSDQAIDNFRSGKYDEQKVFLIVKEPATIIKLLDGGIQIPRLNIGIIFAEDGRTQISKFVSLNKQEVSDLKKIEDRGISIVIQYIPENNPIQFEKAVKNHDFA